MFMFFPKGIWGVIVGLIWIGVSIWGVFAMSQPLKDADNMQKHGYFYWGETQLTLDQYNMIKQYNGQHDYEVVITNPEPLMVKYGFLSLTKYDFLETNKMPNKDFLMGILPLFPILGFAIGVLQIFNAIGNKTQIETGATQ